MNQHKINLIRSSSHLLPPPGGEVARALLDEIEFLQRIIRCTQRWGELYDIIVNPCVCVRFIVEERYAIRPGVYHIEIAAEVANLVEARALYQSFIDLRESRYSPATDEYTGTTEWALHSDGSERDNFIVSKWNKACRRCK